MTGLSNLTENFEEGRDNRDLLRKKIYKLMKKFSNSWELNANIPGRFECEIIKFYKKSVLDLLNIELLQILSNAPRPYSELRELAINELIILTGSTKFKIKFVLNGVRNAAEKLIFSADPN